MIELDYSQKGQILSLGRRCIRLINGILVKGALCEYAEDFVIDNYIATIGNRGKGIPALAYENDVVSQISTSLNFMTYAASRVLSNRSSDERRSSIRKLREQIYSEYKTQSELLCLLK
jgi:hypothetical protein